MKKYSAYLALGILFVVFSVIIFIIPTEKTTTFWIAYVFSVAAFGLQVPIWKKTLRQPDLKSKFLGCPILYIGGIFLVIQMIASIVLMFVPGIPHWVTVIVEIMLLGAAGLGLISGGTVREVIEKTEQHVKEKVSFIRLLTVDIEMLAERETDPAVKAALSDLADAVRFSDPMSSDALSGLETEISEKVAALEHELADKEHAVAEIRQLLVRRNKMCKALK